MKDTMPNDSELTSAEPVIVDKDIEKLRPSTVEVLKAMDRGLSPREAVLIVRGKQALTKNGERQLKDKYAKWSLTRPAMVKMAHKAIQETLAMKPIITADGKEIHPSHTNRLAAAQMVADRVEPLVRRTENVNVNLEAPVDLDALKDLFNRE